VTAALLFAVAGDIDPKRFTVPVSGEPVLGRLVRQLRGHGVESVTVVTDATTEPIVRDLDLSGAVVVRDGVGVELADSVLVAPADVVCHDRVLDLALGAGSRLVVSATGTVPVQVEYGTVVALGRGNTGAAPLLVADSLAGFSVRSEDPVTSGLRGLLAGTSTVRAVDVRGFVCDRVTDREAGERATGALAAVDEDALWLAAAVKADDSPVATYAVSSWTPHVVRRLARANVAPTVVTVLSLLVGAAAALAFAQGDFVWRVAGAVALLAAFALDCVDGQLARYTRRFSAFGGWLDAVGDRAKEYAAYAGLAVGWSSDYAWPLATAALVLQTSRHIADFAYAEARLSRRPTEADGVAARIDAVRRVPWLRRVVVLPIGERFVLIAVTAVIGGGAVVFPAVLAWGALATAYMVGGRLLRSRALPREQGAAVRALRDDGPLVDTLRTGILPGMVTPFARVAWLAVPLLRAAEYAVVVLAGRAADVSWGWVYGCVAALALHHYDLVYRVRQGRPVPRWRRWLTLGWDGRLILVGICAALGGLGVLLPVLAVGVATVVLAESALTWSGAAAVVPVEVAA
jgi:phosphatidylglycerophosphate synthase